MKILVIEDDPAIAKVLGIALRSERIEVDHALNGITGLRMAVSSGYDAIVLDLMLPDKNGEEVCKQLRNAGVTTPIIAISAISDLNTKVKLFGVGVDDYVTKPFEFQELLARIKSNLRKQKVEVGSILTYADLRLDMKKHEVHRDNKLIDLREKEIKILEYLMRHAEQVLTREMILSYVWGPGVERITNVIDVHMHHLREKVDKPFTRKLIKTVNNVGYKLS